MLEGSSSHFLLRTYLYSMYVLAWLWVVCVVPCALHGECSAGDDRQGPCVGRLTVEPGQRQGLGLCLVEGGGGGGVEEG